MELYNTDDNVDPDAIAFYNSIKNGTKDGLCEDCITKIKVTHAATLANAYAANNIPEED